MEDKITLERDVFKALASDTRVKIIKLLGERRHTQSEIAADLKLSVPTVKEHLEAMAKSGLVKQIDEGYKWKYYELTEKSKCILDPERKRVWIMLAVWIVSAVGVVFVFAGKIFTGRMGVFGASRETAALSAKAAPQMEEVARDAVMSEAEDAAAGAAQVVTQEIAKPFPYVEVIVISVLVVVTVLFLIFLFRSKMLRKKK